jgi:SnoaL-like domain
MTSDNRAIIERLRGIYESGDLSGLARATGELSAPDFVQEWPQSGERMTREGSQRINEGYEGATGTTPTFTLRRILGDGDLYVIEGSIDYGDGVPVSYVGIAEFRSNLLTRMTEYFANPFDAPAWRADFVERMEPAGV